VAAARDGAGAEHRLPDEPASDSVNIVFTPSGRRGTVARGTSVLDAARGLGVDVDSVCGGRGICGRCQVTVAEGDFPKHGIVSGAASLEPLTEPEARFDSRKGLQAGRRLGCHARLLGDVVIDVPPESQVHKQVVRKRADVRQIEMDPAIRLHYVEVEKPDMHRPTGDFERLGEALAEQWGLHDLEGIDIRSLLRLQDVLRRGDWKVTVAVHRGARITKIWPGFHDAAYGIAYDVGSTTIAAHLCDLSSGAVLASGGVMNPQIRFGEDLMSRVSYVMMNPGGEAELTQVVRGAVDQLVAEVCAEAGVDSGDVLNLTIVGNPIMHHLLLGLDPTELGQAPFALATNSALTLWATEFELRNVHPDARVYLLPCIAGHVGADAAGVVLSEGPHLANKITLIVDVGTNAEIILGNKDRLLAASSPTGPAFEGAQIRCGQRAAPGAIERFRIDRDSLEPRFKVIGCDLWSDEDGFEAAVAETGVTGICGSGIIEALAEMFLAGVLTADGVIDGRTAERTARVQEDGRTHAYLIREGGDGGIEIRVTQNDVRAIQLAKAALYAGARLLMDTLGIDTVERIVLAGAFGSHIDTKYAMVLGMIPDCPLESVSSAGNAAGTGARVALLNQAARSEIERVVRDIEKVETAVEPRFQEHFIEAVAFPHKSAPYPHLAAAVELPEPSEAPAEETPRRRRRRRG